jgi:hypothetical protein
MNTYHTFVHGRCPIKRAWDYYTLEIVSDETILCEEIERSANIVRGATMTQEKMAKQISELLPGITFKLIGVHSNVRTEVYYVGHASK